MIRANTGEEPYETTNNMGCCTQLHLQQKSIPFMQHAVKHSPYWYPFSLNDSVIPTHWGTRLYVGWLGIGMQAFGSQKMSTNRGVSLNVV